MSATWSLEAIEKLVDGFDKCTWPCNEWTHEAHLIMGVTLVSRFPDEDDAAPTPPGPYDAPASDAPWFLSEVTWRPARRS